MTHSGGCHCGAVRFEVDLPDGAAPTVQECNCSICRKSGFLHLIVPASRFGLIKGKDALSVYRFNTKTAKHTFCRICGIKPFYVPRSNPDGYSVNVRCLDARPADLRIEPFDGANWEENAGRLGRLSRE